MSLRFGFSEVRVIWKGLGRCFWWFGCCIWVFFVWEFVFGAWVYFYFLEEGCLVIVV